MDDMRESLKENRRGLPAEGVTSREGMRKGGKEGGSVGA